MGFRNYIIEYWGVYTIDTEDFEWDYYGISIRVLTGGMTKFSAREIFRKY